MLRYKGQWERSPQQGVNFHSYHSTVLLIILKTKENKESLTFSHRFLSGNLPPKH